MTIQVKQTRFLALDALRGLAIIGMVFSGVMPHEAPWPGYLFHAQVGPPDFKFNPDVPGITWVDLVFPFFLFAMGAAFPLGMNTRVAAGNSKSLLLPVITRGALLVFFAIAIRHLSPYALVGPVRVNYVTALLAFICFFLVFMRFPKLSVPIGSALKAGGILVIAVLIGAHTYFTDLTFDKSKNDIIIVVLANMAVFGAIIWLLTRQNLILRLGLLAFFAAFLFTQNIAGSWTHTVWNFHPAVQWFYQFSFLKYLNIVLPGTILGDILWQARNTVSTDEKSETIPFLPAFICLALVVLNVYGLYTRDLTFNLIGSVGLLATGMFLLRSPQNSTEVLWQKLFSWGTYWLLLGLTFEAMEGGIKKDPSSFSYWFVTSGLAFFTYIFSDFITRNWAQSTVWKAIIQSGQNPMVGYVAGTFFMVPLLGLTKASDGLAWLREQHIYLGIIKSIVITAGVVAITAYTTRRQWFWRT